MMPSSLDHDHSSVADESWFSSIFLTLHVKSPLHYYPQRHDIPPTFSAMAECRYTLYFRLAPQKNMITGKSIIILQSYSSREFSADLLVSIGPTAYRKQCFYVEAIDKLGRKGRQISICDWSLLRPRSYFGGVIHLRLINDEHTTETSSISTNSCTWVAQSSQLSNVSRHKSDAKQC